ncbi:cobaltochelatase subunit [Fuerstiella marisgermanici]|uniref:Cobaltochelatase subunit n=2 Tax=Fuerstiella marisgermanici TaxID=1891926 RepID=A0A1P8WPQ0_9PLAN|nr:cobaltochelatase subunit [Fuerstiella marisgermanici]
MFLTALALPIIALYILKLRLRRIPISTNLFWKQVYDEKPPRSLWQHLRHLLSLLAQLLLLILLVLAISDPYFSWQALQARRIVMVLDTSVSMKATDVSPSRFEASRAAAHDVLDGIRFRDEVAVVSAGSRPEVILGMAGHVPTLRRAIDSVAPVDGGSSLPQAIELARQLLGNHPHSQILVFTDGCADRVDPSMTATDLQPGSTATNEGENSASETALTTGEATTGPDALESESSDPNVVDVQYRIFATSAANIGITQFQARRSLVDPIGYEVLVTLRNASDKPVKGRLELELDGIPADIVPLNLKPDELWTRSIEKTSLEGGLLQASLTQIGVGDSMEESSTTEPTSTTDTRSLNVLPTDDMAWAVVPPRVVQDVLIVSPGNLFLQKVFEANPLVNVTVANDIPEQWPADSIVVLHRLVPETLPAGNVLVIDPEASCNLWDVGEVIANPIVTEQDASSPLMTHIRLDNVLMPEARRLDFQSSIKSLASTVTGETVYVRIPRSDGDCLVLSVNLERSDLAFRTAFPIMITNVLSWFAGQPGELQPALMAGQTTTLGDIVTDLSVDDDEESAAERTLTSPSQQESAILSQQIGPLNEVGVWTVTESPTAKQQQINSGIDSTIDPSFQQIAVNLASVNESDLRPVQGAADEVQNAAASHGWFSRPLWFYLIAVASVFSAFEWFLYQRRWIT